MSTRMHSCSSMGSRGGTDITEVTIKEKQDNYTMLWLVLRNVATAVRITLIYLVVFVLHNVTERLQIIHMSERCNYIRFFEAQYNYMDALGALLPGRFSKRNIFLSPFPQILQARYTRTYIHTWYIHTYIHTHIHTYIHTYMERPSYRMKWNYVPNTNELNHSNWD